MPFGFSARRSGPDDQLGRLTSHAKAVLVWERVWPLLAPFLVVGGLFLAVSWVGFWTEVPRWGRVAGTLVFGAGLLACLWGAIRFRLPTRPELLARLDRDSGIAHRPATTIGDAIANQQADASTSVLWDLHLRRARAMVSRLKVSPPSPGLPARDRYALRAGALVAVAAAGFIAGPEKYARVLAAFDWSTAGALSQGFRLDAWIDPPAYTGRPPILLRANDDSPTATKGQSRRVEAPVGSMIVVRASAGSSVAVETEVALEAPKPEADAKDKTASAPPKAPVPATTTSTDQENRFSLKGDGRLVIRRSGTIVGAYDVISVPDRPPTIELKGDPKPNARGSLTVGYKIDDDYGVVGAEATFANPVINGRAVKGRTLVEPPRMGLSLPSGAGGLGEAETTADLSEHPWAGARVTMTLTARDEGDNVGQSNPVEMTLPQRTFVKPLARALVEQRRNLILSPDDRARVSAALEALMIAPERFKTTANIYLGLYTIASRLSKAKTDEALVGVADLMWEMALRLEDGDLSDAERDLRALQQQLREALQRGAPPEEISKLTEQLRAALDKFLRELADQMRRDQNSDQQQADNQFNPDRMITSQDLQSMLDRLEDMAKSGNTADAQRMLDQLQNMLENLQSAQRRSAQDQASREMNRQLGELDKLMREQQELRDKTFNQSQRNRQSQRNQQQRGQQGQRQQNPQSQRSPQSGEPDQGDDDQMADNDQNGENGQSLQEQQENLRKRLDELQRSMKQLGMKGGEGFDEAEDAMKDAEKNLGQGQQGQGKAVDAQGKALDALRRGAESLAQQMQQQQGGQAGNGPGPGDPNGPMRQGRNNGNPDPLGRESHDRGDNSRSLYDPPGLPAAQRAQRVLEELRRRLSDPNRPREELDYLERLLKRY